MQNAPNSADSTFTEPLLSRTTATPPRPPNDWEGIDRTAKRSKTQEPIDDDKVVDMEIVDPQADDNHGAIGASNSKSGMGKSASYANILTGRNYDDQNREEKERKELEDLSDDETEDQDEEDRACPVVTLTKEEKRRLRRPWKHTLIIKVWGRQVGYAYLLRRITMLWKPRAKLDLIAMENDYFMAKFHSIDDYEHALYGGP